MKNFRVVALLMLIGSLTVACNLGPLREGSFQKTFKVGSKANLRVETNAGNITVHTGPAQSVVISGHIRARGGFPGPSAESKI
jgi:hypothetical protein